MDLNKVEGLLEPANDGADSAGTKSETTDSSNLSTQSETQTTITEAPKGISQQRVLNDTVSELYVSSKDIQQNVKCEFTNASSCNTEDPLNSLKGPKNHSKSVKFSSSVEDFRFGLIPVPGETKDSNPSSLNSLNIPAYRLMSPELNFNMVPEVHTIRSKIRDCLGNTPLKELCRIPIYFNLKCKIFAKCEYVGPTGSIKDRVAEDLIKEAEENGTIVPGLYRDTLIVPLSATLAIALAQMAIVKGYYVIAILPDSCPTAKIDILHSLGGEIVRGSYADIPRLVDELVSTIPNSYLINEYKDFSKIPDMYSVLTEELTEDFDGEDIDIIVFNPESAGICEAMKAKNSKCNLIGVLIPEDISELDNSKSLSEELKYFDRVTDKVYAVYEKDALKMSRSLLSCEALPSSQNGGACLCGALRAIYDFKLSDKTEANVLIILEDGLQNCSPNSLDDSWMIKNKFYSSEDMASQHWWSDMTVGRLNLRIPNQIEKTFSIRFALDAMLSEGSEELIVVDNLDNSIVVGITTRGLLETGLAAKTLDATMSLEQDAAISTNFTILAINATLKEVAERGKTAFYFVVVMKHHFIGSESNALEHRDAIVGFFTPVEVLKYTCGIEEHHKLNLKTDLNNPFISFDPTTPYGSL